MTITSIKTNVTLKTIIAEDYIKYSKYAELSEEDDMSYLRPKGIYIINYIEQLFLRLFDDDIEEYIERHCLKGDVE